MLNCLVQNEPGVLSRVSGILAGRGFNIDSLVVCRTEIRDLSRMCIVISGQDGVVEQARRQLEDLVRYPSFLPFYTQPYLLSPRTLYRVVSGARVGRSGLYGDAHDLARTAPRQSVYPRARVPRRPARRRTLARAARRTPGARRADQARARDDPRAALRGVQSPAAPASARPVLFIVIVIDVRGWSRRRWCKAAHAERGAAYAASALAVAACAREPVRGADRGRERE